MSATTLQQVGGSRSGEQAATQIQRRSRYATSVAKKMRAAVLSVQLILNPPCPLSGMSPNDELTKPSRESSSHHNDLPTPPHARRAARSFLGARECGAQPHRLGDRDNISATFRLPIRKARRMFAKV